MPTAVRFKGAQRFARPWILSSSIVRNRPKNSLWMNSPHLRTYWRLSFTADTCHYISSKASLFHTLIPRPTPATLPTHTSCVFPKAVCVGCVVGEWRGSLFFIASSREAWHAAEKSSATCEVSYGFGFATQSDSCIFKHHIRLWPNSKTLHVSFAEKASSLCISTSAVLIFLNLGCQICFSSIKMLF